MTTREGFAMILEGFEIPAFGDLFCFPYSLRLPVCERVQTENENGN